VPDLQHEFLMYALLGDVAAVDFCERVFEISQVWDDLVDGDNPTEHEVARAYWQALVSLPAHPFYQQHLLQLSAQLERAMLDYIASVELERAQSVHDKTLAFVLRDSLSSVVVYCARLVGGFDHAAAIAADVQRFFCDEDLPSYLRSVK
jgi:hypothetical protein